MSAHNWQNPYSGNGLGPYLTKAVKILIAVNVALFILVHLLPKLPWFSLFGLVPGFVFAKLRVWQPVTYMFLHAGLWHLVVNMLMLWFFAPPIEAAWGRKQFLFYYFFTGIGAGLCSFVTSFRSYVPVVGASGAIFGILVAYAILYPETVILFFFIFPMKIKHAVWVLVGINLLGILSSPNSGIAYFAHLGGGLFGYLYLKSESLRRQISYLNLSELKLWWARRKAGRKRPPKEDLSRQIDLILDKISKCGMDSLTGKEKEILEQKSKE
ncbi:MAG: rhomboid family intramembrane serine protease [Candidatus Omnitrophota bacterium]